MIDEEATLQAQIDALNRQRAELPARYAEEGYGSENDFHVRLSELQQSTRQPWKPGDPLVLEWLDLVRDVRDLENQRHGVVNHGSPVAEGAGKSSFDVAGSFLKGVGEGFLKDGLLGSANDVKDTVQSVWWGVTHPLQAYDKYNQALADGFNFYYDHKDEAAALAQEIRSLDYDTWQLILDGDVEALEGRLSERLLSAVETAADTLKSSEGGTGESRIQ